MRADATRAGDRGRWRAGAIVAVFLSGIVTGCDRDLYAGDEEGLRRAKSDLDELERSLALYRSNCGMFPTGAQGLAVLVERPTASPMPKRWQKMYDKLPPDPWGNDYHYRQPAVKSGGSFDVYSAGRDGKPGTADDIGNWES